MVKLMENFFFVNIKFVYFQIITFSKKVSHSHNLSAGHAVFLTA